MNIRKTDTGPEIPEGEEWCSRNIFGMGRMRQMLYSLYMATESEQTLKFPKAKNFPPCEDCNNRECEDASCPSNQALTAALSEHGTSEEKGIPLFKLSSNDGWIVTAQECRDALEHLENATPEEIEKSLQEVDGDRNSLDNPFGLRRSWDDFLVFLRLAAAHDGFEVW